MFWNESYRFEKNEKINISDRTCATRVLPTKNWLQTIYTGFNETYIDFANA